MTATTTVPVARILYSYRRPFLWVMCITFAVLAALVFALPKQLVIVRSCIELGTSTIDGKQRPIEPLDEVLKRVARIYGPKAQAEFAKKKTPPSTIAALGNSQIEDVGLSVLLISTIDLDAESEAWEYQQSIASQMIRDLAPRATAVRQALAAQMVWDRKSADNLEQQIKDTTAEIARIDTFGENLRNQLQDQRAATMNPDQNHGTGRHTESTTIDSPAQTQDGATSQTVLAGNLALERASLTHDLVTLRRQYETRINSIDRAQSEANTVTETRVSMPPLSVPLTTVSRRPQLLFVAFLSSILIAFGTIVMLHHVMEPRN